MLTQDDRRQLWDQLHAGGAQDRAVAFPGRRLGPVRFDGSEA